MARKIQHKRGPEKDLPRLEIAEWALTTDTEKPFIGAASGNVEIAKKKDVEAVSSEVSKKADATEVTALGSQLADTTSDLKVLNTTAQVDFVSDLQKLASHQKQMNVEVVYGTSQVFHVNVRLSPTKGVAYKFQKNANDDYIIQYGSFIGDIEEFTAVTNAENYDDKTGTFYENYPPNFYTLTIGDTITKTFEGERIDFYSYCTPQGGLWEFILDEGTADEQRVEISVFNAGANVYKQQKLFDNLPVKKHTVKGVFRGEDPANPVTSPRGYFYVGGIRSQDTYRTFYVYNTAFKINKTHDVLYSASNKEFALEARPAGSTATMQYIPEHNLTGTAFKIVDAKLLADGKPVEWLANSYTVNVETVQLIQKVHGIFPSEPDNPLVEITTYHTIKDGVLTISGKIKFLRDTEVGNGYTMMFPYWVSFAKKILTSKGNEYEVRTSDTKTTEYISEKDENKSFLILNNVDNGDDRIRTALAMTVDNFKQTMRLGEEGTSPDETRIEHRSSTIGKIYLHQLKNITLPAGYEYKFDGRFITTIIDEVKDLYL